MAFNPFHTFRRHQKKMFVALTIVCMFIFVLSSGMGDGDWLTMMQDRLAGRGGGGPKAAATLYGKDVDEQTIANTQRKRLIANRYIESAVELAHEEIIRNAFQQRDKVDPVLQQQIDQLNQLMQFGNMLGPQFLMRGFINLSSSLAQARQVIDAGSSSNKSDQLRIVEDLQLMLTQKADRLSHRMESPRESYFGGDVQNLDDTLDFLIWKHKADQLGIDYSSKDVADEVSTETLHWLTKNASKLIDEHLRSEYRGMYSPDFLTEALTEEFRVRSARTILEGVRPLFHTMTYPPVTPTPDEAYDWFKDNRTLVRVGLVELPVASFVDKVTETPTEAQLKELFAKHKNDEPNPALERPGFKEPRRVSIAWIAIPDTSEFHRTVATAAMALDPIMMEARLAEKFERYVSDSPTWTGPLAYGYRSGLHDSSVLRAENIAAFVGDFAGAGLSGAPTLSAPLALEANAIVREIRDRTRIGVSSIMAAAADSGPWGVDALRIALTPPSPSFRELRPALFGRVQEELAKLLVQADQDRFQAELIKRGKDGADSKAIDSFVNEFITSRQLEHGSSTSPRDRHELAGDPGVARLRAAHRRRVMARGGDDAVGESFAAELFDGPNDPTNRSAKPQKFQTQSLPSYDANYIFWRSEDLDPKVLTFEQARPQVLAAWKFAKARELAQVHAERLATEAKGMDEQKLRDLAARSSQRMLIELPPMGQLNQQLAVATGGPPQYAYPNIPRDRVTYPGDMAAKVVDLRTQSAGATSVVADQPKSVYYVASLLGKDVPTVEEFRTIYRNSMAPPMVRDPLMRIFQGQRQEAFRKGLMDQLRAEANLKKLKEDRDQEG